MDVVKFIRNDKLTAPRKLTIVVGILYMVYPIVGIIMPSISDLVIVDLLDATGTGYAES